jgi:serine/threonine protein kinase
MLELEHPNIIRLETVYESRGSVYLVLELLRGGDLYDKIHTMKSMSEEKAKQILKSVLDALCYIHEKRVMHRDLKPENILLKNESNLNFEVKLADFGLATRVDVDEYLYPKSGTPGYVAPEIFTAAKRYEPVVDIFSLGIVFYSM